jgi:hypothetical protein
MRYTEIAAPLNEVHWTDLYPKGFQEFRAKYLRLVRQRKHYGLYVQFTNHADNTMDRTAFQAPDHHDMTGVYAYPLDYVLTHPADVWYGKGARYMRVLRDESKMSLDLSYIDSEGKAERFLNQMGFNTAEIDTVLSLVKKHFKDRIKGTNRFAKMFLSAVQVDVLSPPIGHRDAGMFSKGGPEFRIRTGAEQTELFRKMGVDAIIDASRTNKAAIINDREPEQICFLTRNAFRVVEVFSLRPGIPDDQLPSMTHSAPDTQRIERPLVAMIAKALDDRITEWAKDPKLRQKIEFDAPYRYYWTAKGRRIEIEFERPSSYYDSRQMGEKKHRESKLSDSYMTRIKIRTELGDMNSLFGSDKTFADMVRYVVTQWNELKQNPRTTTWQPQTAASFMDGIKAQKAEETRKRIEKDRAERLSEWPQVAEHAAALAGRYNLPFAPPEDDESRQSIVKMLSFLSNLSRHEGMSQIDVPATLEKWKETARRWIEGTRIDASVMQTIEQMSSIIERGATESTPRWWMGQGERMFAVLRANIKEREMRAAAAE